MLHYYRIEVSEGINVNKTSESKECDNCHYWYFLNTVFKFQSYVCNRCHDSLIKSTNPSDIAILKIKIVDYCGIISIISKSEVLNLMRNIDLTEVSPDLTFWF